MRASNISKFKILESVWWKSKRTSGAKCSAK